MISQHPPINPACIRDQTGGRMSGESSREVPYDRLGTNLGNDAILLEQLLL
jgi:hypothetical protein